MDWSTVAQNFLEMLIPIVITVLSTIIALGLKALQSWVAAKAKNENIVAILTPLTEVITANVSAVEQEVRKYMADGKLSVEERIKLKNDAIQRITSQAPQLIESLGRIGLAEVEKFIGAKIEEVILNMNKGTK